MDHIPKRCIINAAQILVRAEPYSHTEYVKFEPSPHTTINKLEDFHIVSAV
ncbi:MAG: hypothetical protein R3321_12510 [Nitrososphaeraceae archaeon]|nr:hypothetical protein [Nitrososphaeraceae archaeon]